MQCPTCGAALSEHGSHCPACGARAGQSATSVVEPPVGLKFGNFDNWILLGILLGFPFYKTHYGREFLIFYVIMLVVLLVYNGTYAIVGAAMRLDVRELAIGGGGALLTWATTWCRFRWSWFPLTGSVQFRGEPPVRDGCRPYLALSHRMRVVLILSGPVLVGALGVALLGHRASLSSLIATFQQARATGMLRTSLRKFFELIRTGRYVTALGIVSFANALLNLLPLPMLSGGIALRTAIQGIRSRHSDRI